MLADDNFRASHIAETGMPATPASHVQSSMGAQTILTPIKRKTSVVHRQKNGSSSAFRGVTRHSSTGRFEAHLWDSSCIRPKTVGPHN